MSVGVEIVKVSIVVEDVQYKSVRAVLTYDIDSYNIATVTKVVVGEKYSG